MQYQQLHMLSGEGAFHPISHFKTLHSFWSRGDSHEFKSAVSSTGTVLSGTLGLDSNRSEDMEVAGLFSLISRPLQRKANPRQCS